MPSHTAWSTPAGLKMAFGFCFALLLHSLTMLREASDEPVAAKEAEGHVAESSRCPGNPSSCTRRPDTSEDERAEDPARPPTGIPTLVSVLLPSAKTKPQRSHVLQGYLSSLSSTF